MAIFLLSIISQPDSIATLSWSQGLSETESTIGIVENSQSYISHDPIRIYNNGDFFDQGWPGTGTEGDPYLIEGLEIVTDFDAIIIYGTTVHFIIRNCLVKPITDAEHRDAIRVSSSQNGAVINCIVIGFDNGIYIANSVNTTVGNNSVSNCANIGIRIYSSNTCDLVNNLVTNSSGDGISISDSDFCNVLNNTSWENLDDGLSLAMRNSLAANNTAYANGNDGITFGGSRRTTLANNSAYNNTEAGMSAYEPNYCTVTNNDAFDNGNYGFYFTRPMDCIIANNTISQNSFYGFALMSQINCSIAGNILLNNGFYVYGSQLSEWMIDEVDNTVNSKSLGYFINESDLVIDATPYGQIFLVNCSRITIHGGVFGQANIAIGVYFSEECVVDGVTIGANIAGVWLYNSEDCTLVDNVLSDSGFVVIGSEISNWIHTFTGNSINGQPMGYFRNQTGATIDGSQYGQVIVVNSTNMRIENGSFIDASQGIAIVFSNNSQIINNTLEGGFYGIRLRNLDGCHFENNTVSGTSGGIILFSSTKCTFANNTLLNNGYGYYMRNSTYCRVNTSTVQGNLYGIYLRYSSQLNVSSNSVMNNRYGFYHYNIEDCTFDNNDVRESTYQGVWSYYSNHLVFLNNSFYLNEGHGLYITSSLHIAVIDNIFSHNSADGLSIWTTDFGLVVNNTAEYNGDYGIMLHHFSYNITVYGNYLISNSVGNGYSYEPNTWDDGVSIGNYWSDYLWTGQYNVPGPGNSVDRFPRGPTKVADHSDVQLQFDTLGHSIVWQAGSGFPDTYTIYRNGIVIDSDIWNGSSLSVSLDGLVLGEYNYTLLVNDTLGISANDTVIVTVYDNPPTINKPSDIAYNFDTVVGPLTWNPTDINPDAYEIFHNNQSIDSGEWEGTRLSTSVNGLQIGEHNYTLFVNDTSGNFATDTVWVVVYDYPPELLTPLPSDIVYHEGTIGHYIHWNVSEFNPDRYEIHRNDSLILSGHWDGLPVSVSVDGLAVGFYNYTVMLNDTSGNVLTDEVLVTVIPATQPPTSSTTTTTTSTPPPLLPGPDFMLFAIGLGISASIIIVLVVIIRRRG